jgi:hypothetical protein
MAKGIVYTGTPRCDPGTLRTNVVHIKQRNKCIYDEEVLLWRSPCTSLIVGKIPALRLFSETPWADIQKDRSDSVVTSPAL